MCSFRIISYHNDRTSSQINVQAAMIENSMQSGQIFTYQERLKETEENNAELRKILRRYSKGDKLTKSPFAKLES